MLANIIPNHPYEQKSSMQFPFAHSYRFFYALWFSYGLAARDTICYTQFQQFYCEFLTAISKYFERLILCGFFIPVYVYTQSKEWNFKLLIFRHWFSICQFRDSFYDSYYSKKIRRIFFLQIRLFKFCHQNVICVWSDELFSLQINNFISFVRFISFSPFLVFFALQISLAIIALNICRKKCILYVCNGFNMKLVSGSKETSYCFLGILSVKNRRSTELSFFSRKLCWF